MTCSQRIDRHKVRTKMKRPPKRGYNTKYRDKK